MVLNLQAGFVKYYRESVDNYNIPIKQAIYNPRGSTTYVKITLVDQGSLGFTFGDGTTEKTLSVGANSSITAGETLVPSTTPTETMKDHITLKIEYFKNSNYSGKFGEDTVQYQINYYIQNQDGSWTSSQYPNEDDIIYDQWTSNSFNVSANAGIVGIKGVLKLTHGGATTIYVQEVPGIVSDIAAQMKSYTSGYSYSSRYYYMTAYQYLKKVSDGNPPGNVIFAGIIKYDSGDNGKVSAGFSGVGDVLLISSSGGIGKFILYPSMFQQYIKEQGSRYVGSYSEYSIDVVFTIDGLIAFNPLP
ncbi:hypothetical protein [Thermococcus aciditolerans]|uniref:Uncharacterized protein n=1 Tax=Thermococcus aciditolerans TaxID=2598455 RepID=A0A5C0SLU7_9EURY|nr:hypothetical protein [Thermococcus aciditolerans]QEK14757.1 hypothetical protein FPV09_06215 [Thermococcus aciditolerans]